MPIMHDHMRYPRRTDGGVAVRLAGEAGCKLVAAGAAYPYGHGFQPYPIGPDVSPSGRTGQAMEVFVVCVRLATVRQQWGCA